MIELAWRIIGKLKRYIQYSIVGMVGVAIHFTILYLLTDKAHIWYIASAIIAITCASTNNYILNYLWTFKDKKHLIANHFIAWLKFLLSIGITEVLYLGLLYLFTDKCGLHYMLGAFLSLSLTTVIRYFTAEKWIWHKKKTKVVY